MTGRTSIRPAVFSDIGEIYPDLMSVPYSLRAWAIDLDGHVAALAGFIMQPGQPIAFSCLKPGLVAPKMLFMRTAREMLAIMQETRLPLVAIRSVDYGNSAKFLRALGFEPEGQEVYKWPIH